MKVQVDGKEVEVLTPEEAQAKITEATTVALETYKKEHPDQTAEMTKLQGDLTKVQADLAAAEGKGDTPQIQRLRKERDDAQKALTEGIATLTKDFTEFKNSSVTETKNALMDRYAGTNKEMREKIQFEFDKYNPTANMKADIEERMAKAFALASGGKPAPKFTDNLSSSGGRGDGYVPTETKQETANGVAMRKAFGITDEQFKKGQEVLKKINK